MIAAASALALLLVLLVAPSALAADGTLDMSRTHPLDGTRLDEARATVVLSDGSIAVAGRIKDPLEPTNNLYVTRFLSNGDPDTLGWGNIRTIDLPGYTTEPTAMVEQGGYLFIAGWRATASGSNMLVARVDEVDGAFDPTWGGGDGWVEFAIGTGSSKAYDIAIDTSGRIVVVGQAVNGTADFATVRLNPDGTLDETFNPTMAGGAPKGVVFTDFGGSTDVGKAVAIAGDNDIYVAGNGIVSGDQEIVIARLNDDGSLDGGFTGLAPGTSIATSTGTADSATGLALGPTGKPMIASNRGGDIAVVRMTTTGAMDTYGTTGWARWPGVGSEFSGDFVVDASGRAVITGYGGATAYTVRFDAAGMLDTTWNGGTTNLTLGSAIGSYGIAAHPTTGYIVIAGGTSSTGSPGDAGTDTFIARYTNGVVVASSSNVDVSGCSGAASSFPPMVAGSQAVTTTDCTVVFSTSATMGADLQVSRGNAGSAMREPGGATIPDYADGSNDWDMGTGFFGICLSNVQLGAGPTWTANATCPSLDGAYWRAVPSSPSTAAYVLAPDSDSQASFRFGVRTQPSQPVGIYAAPIIFTVVPNP